MMIIGRSLSQKPCSVRINYTSTLPDVPTSSGWRMSGVFSLPLSDSLSLCYHSMNIISLVLMIANWLHLQVGQDMNARHILLTHFSQRYAKVPIINDLPTNVGIAFDNMKVSKYNTCSYSLFWWHSEVGWYTLGQPKPFPVSHTLWGTEDVCGDLVHMPGQKKNYASISQWPPCALLVACLHIPIF